MHVQRPRCNQLAALVVDLIGLNRQCIAAMKLALLIIQRGNMVHTLAIADQRAVRVIQLLRGQFQPAPLLNSPWRLLMWLATMR